MGEKIKVTAEIHLVVKFNISGYFSFTTTTKAPPSEEEAPREVRRYCQEVTAEVWRTMKVLCWLVSVSLWHPDIWNVLTPLFRISVYCDLVASPL